MSQIDWVGGKQKKPFKDIGNTRPSVAEEKAALCLELGALLRKIPDSAKNGSVQQVRDWKMSHEVCEKVAGSKKSTVTELTSAINRMKQYFQ